MHHGMIKIGQSIEGDIDAITRVEADSWPSALAASKDAIARRVSVYPEGQWVAVRDGQIVGVAFAQRMNPPLPPMSDLTYDLVTGGGSYAGTHVANGTWYQLIGVGVVQSAHGLRIGRSLIDRQIEFARTLPGVVRIIGFTRPARFHESSELSIEDYTNRRTESGRFADPVLSFHLDSGARLVSIHPDFRPDDVQARGYGILIEYPIDQACE